MQCFDKVSVRTYLGECSEIKLASKRKERKRRLFLPTPVQKVRGNSEATTTTTTRSEDSIVEIVNELEGGSLSGRNGNEPNKRNGIKKSLRNSFI